MSWFKQFESVAINWNTKWFSGKTDAKNLKKKIEVEL